MTQKTQTTLASEDLAEIRDGLNDLSSHGTLIYETKGQAIYRFQVANRDLIAKSYQLNSLAQKTAAVFKHSRGHRSFRAGNRFFKADINTPKPLLLLETGGIIPSATTLITEYCPFPALLDSIHKGDPVHPSTPEKILTLLHQLSSTKCSHGDFHARNLLIDDDGTPHLIDLDGVRNHFRSADLTRYICNDRDRLLKSLHPLPEHHREFSSVLGEPGTPIPPSPSNHSS